MIFLASLSFFFRSAGSEQKSARPFQVEHECSDVPCKDPRRGSCWRAGAGVRGERLNPLDFVLSTNAASSSSIKSCGKVLLEFRSVSSGQAGFVPLESIGSVVVALDLDGGLPITCNDAFVLKKVPVG